MPDELMKILAWLRTVAHAIACWILPLDVEIIPMHCGVFPDGRTLVTVRPRRSGWLFVDDQWLRLRDGQPQVLRVPVDAWVTFRLFNLGGFSVIRRIVVANLKAAVVPKARYVARPRIDRQPQSRRIWAIVSTAVVRVASRRRPRVLQVPGVRVPVVELRTPHVRRAVVLPRMPARHLRFALPESAPADSPPRS